LVIGKFNNETPPEIPSKNSAVVYFCYAASEDSWEGNHRLRGNYWQLAAGLMNTKENVCILVTYYIAVYMSQTLPIRVVNKE